MTPKEIAAAEGLDFDRGTAAVAEILKSDPTRTHRMLEAANEGVDAHVPIMSMSELIVAEDAAEQAREAPAAPRKRSTPVKGLCRWCGKNWSRHYVIYGEDGSIRYCTGAATQKFEPIPADAPPPAPAPPATAGGITAEDAKQLRELLLKVDLVKAVYAQASQSLDDAQSQQVRAEDALEAFIDSLTVRP